MECVNSPSRECLTSPPFLLPIGLFLLLIAVGYRARLQDKRAFRKLRRRTLLASFAILGVTITVISAFFVFNPEVVVGADVTPLAETIWVVAVSVFGGAIALLAGALGLSLGGAIAKAVTPKAPKRALVIAIDGPAASGKGTLAKRVAKHFGLPYLDTGLLYRAVARDVAATGKPLDNVEAAVAAARSLKAATLDDPKLRGPLAGDAASIVARIAPVRAALLDYQRAFAAKPGGAVLDGRDIGTVVCPNADVKIFVTASPEERARRRHLEHQGRGEAIPYDQVLADIRARDARDMSRDIAPLEAAADALRLDTTTLDADAAFAAALELVSSKVR